MMKRFTVTATLVFASCFLGTLVQAQQPSPLAPIAPILNGETLVAVKIDISQIHFDQLQKLALDAVGQYVTLQGFDEESIDDIKDEAASLLADNLPPVKAMYDDFVAQTGIQDIYFVTSVDLLDTRLPGVIAIPKTGKTNKQLNAIKDFLEEYDLPGGIGYKDLILIPAVPNNKYNAAQFAQSLRDYFKNFQPAEVPALNEAFADSRGDLIRAAVTVPKSLVAILEEKVPPVPFPQAAALLHQVTHDVRWINLQFNPSELHIGAAIQMSSEKAAVKFRKTLLELVDMGIMMTKAGMQEGLTDPQLEKFVPLLTAYFRGLYRAMLPKVRGDQLVYEVDAETSDIAAAVGVGGVMAALLLPAVQAAREAARRMQCSNNLKQIALSMHNFHDARQTFPPAYTVDKDGKPLHSWRVLILPFIEQQALYEQIRLEEPWDSEHNKQFHNVNIPAFQCPSNGQAGPGLNCHYSVVVGKETPFEGSKQLTFGAITDGTSNTVMCVERRDPVCWMDPTSELTYEEVLESGINRSPEGIGSFHTGGLNVVFCDGAVRFLPETVDLEILKAILTKAGGESAMIP
ncbi:MAG: DUF1559 domain-containing protein [Planctomycetaceae bacterium]|jgi:prepilin-type processing-associated H-X9-DG protein|nr:DUF1559 domain-containing protein [Planctomycetaceae bacterium]